MRTFDLRKMAAGGEYVLGVKDTGSHACYMIYGVLGPGEKGRLVRPGKGHEEIVLSARGEIRVTGAVSGPLPEGSAFHIAGEAECFLENAGSGEAVYVIAGGHPPEGGGHHR
ncbi:MAG: hypothetical protein Kow0025_12480 [Thermodesulfovibrionales bacterium]